jgi:ferrochelatase
MKSAVLLLAHGAPERIEDVDSYLSFVRGGRPGNPEVLEEVRHRYRAIGGSSPLLRWTRTQAQALEQILNLPVYFGMRNWNPFIREVMDKVRKDGIQKLAALCLAPQYSVASIGLYMKRTEEAAKEMGFSGPISWAKTFHDEPLLIDAFAERLQEFAERHGPLNGPDKRVLFTAHSLPEKAVAGGDPYDTETRATAAAVAKRAGIESWEFAYQSQGMTGDKWLGPTVESCLDRYAAEGIREVIVDPVGFVCDHVEVLYDIDMGFHEYGAAKGIHVSRPESLNGSETFTRALAKVAGRCL